MEATSLTRRILFAISGLVLLGFAAGASLLMAAATGQDDVAAAASLRAVEAALAATQRRLIGAATDYANWDEAIDNLHFTVNPEWTAAYLNQDYLDAMELDEVLVFAPDNRIAVSFAQGGSPVNGEALRVNPDLLRLLSASRQRANGPPSAVGFLSRDGTLHVAAVSRIRYVDDTRSPTPDQSSVFFVARHLDQKGLNQLQRDHALEPLRFSAGKAASGGDLQRLPITALGGDLLGEIVWTPPRPGDELLRRVAPSVGLATGLMLVLLATIARTARHAGAALDLSATQLTQARDALEQKVAALHQTQTRLREIFDNSAEGIFQLGADGRYLDANPAMAMIFGYASVQEFLARACDHTLQDPDRRAEFLQLMETFGEVRDFVSTARRRDGSPIWISQNARSVHHNGEFVFYEGMLTDITHRKRVEEQLVHDALHDVLTGLPNRKLFENRLTQALRRAETSGQHPAVLLIDCDRFKLINDSLGHVAGDELLVALSQRLSLRLRRTDTLARLGGDEFAVLTDGGVELMRVAERLQESCRQPFLLQGRDIALTLSIGAATVDGERGRPADLVRNADIAMYQAKARGGGTAVHYTPDMHERVLERLRIENDLRFALTRGDVRVVYQPIVSLQTGLIAGFEALARWHHPDRGLIGPEQFIPIAEETNLIHSLGETVLRQATGDLAKWLQRTARSDLFVAVNLSAVELSDERIVERIAAILRDTGLPPRLLKLEITESAVIRNPVDVHTKLQAINASGVRLCIDDFGTGYSSLSQLYNYPFETLKIDRSFVAKLRSGEDGRAVVRSILALASNLRLTVVAEGVEEHSQREWLRTEGCTFGQGYLFARPIPPAEAEALLHAGADA